MHYVGIDLHKNASQVCIYDEDREKYVERRARTDLEGFQRALEKYAGARVLLEASTESEWVARLLEQLGFEVLVADPNFAPMYARRNRRIKTERRDARALSDACRHGTYRPATGATGVGKSYLACALGQMTCRLGLKVVYRRVPRLFEELRIAKAEGSYARKLLKLAKMDLLILDDLGLGHLDETQRHDLLEVLEDRYGKRSTIVTSQLPLPSWHEWIGDPTLADAIWTDSSTTRTRSSSRGPPDARKPPRTRTEPRRRPPSLRSDHERRSRDHEAIDRAITSRGMRTCARYAIVNARSTGS